MLRNGTQLETWPRCLNLLEPVCAHEITAVVTVTAVTGSTSATIAETIPWLLELPWICIQETRGDLSVALKFSTRTLRSTSTYWRWMGYLMAECSQRPWRLVPQYVDGSNHTCCSFTLIPVSFPTQVLFPTSKLEQYFASTLTPWVRVVAATLCTIAYAYPMRPLPWIRLARSILFRSGSMPSMTLQLS